MRGLRGSGDIRSYIRKQKKAGQTYGSIADSLGISTGTLYNWRKGRTSPRESTLIVSEMKFFILKRNNLNMFRGSNFKKNLT